jgi:hypothetical protein
MRNDLRARSSKLQATSFRLQGMSLQVPTIQDASYELRDTRYKIVPLPADDSIVPDMETGRCLDPGENGPSLKGGGGPGPAHLRGRKIGSWSQAKAGTTWRKKSPFRHDGRRSAANRVSSHLIMLVFYMSVTVWVFFIVTTVFFFQENKSHSAQPFALILCLHICWSSRFSQVWYNTETAVWLYVQTHIVNW